MSDDGEGWEISGGRPSCFTIGLGRCDCNDFAVSGAASTLLSLGGAAIGEKDGSAAPLRSGSLRSGSLRSPSLRSAAEPKPKLLPMR
jgi:hypothetical protein